MNNVTYSETMPPKEKYWELFLTTGWNEAYQATPETLLQAVANSAFYISAYDGDKLVGFGRVLSDGYLHATIYEMIIEPTYQRQGIGSEILTRLVEKCVDLGITDIQLFCAKGKVGFYQKHGFVVRPTDAPGMQYSYSNQD
jgi:ribosomal protein S18 acetylase RimI-like enzyme